MNEILRKSILGMSLTGAILTISVPLSLLFNTPMGNILKIIIAGSATVFVIFAISALVIRQRLDKQAG